jgi:peptide/nickel transport system ATP-binding protein
VTALLHARNVTAVYATGEGPDVQAVSNVSIELLPGEVLGIAGESGCGKSTLAALITLTARSPLVATQGTLRIAEQRIDLTHLETVHRDWRGKLVALLPQGAMNALNPTIRVRDLAYHVISAHEPGITREEVAERTSERLQQLSLPVRAMESYPHQLSGGMRQRVVAVISTLLNPKVLVADEPTSALDVSAQRALVELLRELLGRGFIEAVAFITHDLALLSTVADRIAIMYAGQLAESGSCRDIVDRPRHPYTTALMDTVLVPEPQVRQKRVEGIRGAPPDLRFPPAGCRFHPRCRHVMDVCRESEPPLVGDGRQGVTGGTRGFAACWWVQQQSAEEPVHAQ